MDGNELPRLVYVSREMRPKFNHQTKAGALNALVSKFLGSHFSIRFDFGLYHLIFMVLVPIFKCNFDFSHRFIIFHY